MGWSSGWYTCKELLADRIEGHETETRKQECLEHTYKLGALWTVWEITDKTNNAKTRFIGIDLIKRFAKDDWGYKDICEAMGPCRHDCPIQYLDMVPESLEGKAWREKVREYHAKMQRKFNIGDVVKLIKCRIPEVTIISIKPFRGVYMGNKYKLQKSIIE